jgi:hypothetical protein
MVSAARPDTPGSSMILARLMDIATKARPTKAPAAPAAATKKSDQPLMTDSIVQHRSKSRRYKIRGSEIDLYSLGIDDELDLSRYG